MIQLSYANDTIPISLRKLVDNINMSFQSYSNDTLQVSTYKMAHNFWAWAASLGYTGTEPYPSDTIEILLRKAVDATAYLA